MRSRISGQRAPAYDVSTPRSGPSWAVRAMSAGKTNIFVGMQPTLRQVPPKVLSSMIATRHPESCLVTMVLPEPVPIRARS